ncbi:MAG: class I SAM-dependent methyltransferase [Bacteroidales bacterium]|nr:class I SAM-dependent methyltransferase [Bacteroidales bacterium]
MKKNKTGTYYDEWTEHYMNTGYGNVIQAHRPADVNQLLDYIALNANIKDGMQILDAGCGICGPAIFFAQKFNIKITALTISPKQSEIAKNLIEENNLSSKIDVMVGDYHHLDKYFEPQSFDLVIMLESFGHCLSQKKVIAGINNVLKDDAHLYIKDYFKKGFNGSSKRRSDMKKIMKNMNKIYSYNLPDPEETYKILRSMDMEMIYMQRNKLPLFNDDSVKQFEKNHDIDVFMGGFHYQILEPLELYFKKPGNIDADII